MNDPTTIQARNLALAEIDKLERNFKLAIVGGCLIEVALLYGLFALMDFHNHTHLLLAIGFVGSYSIVVMAIVALGAHVSRVGQRLVRALEAMTHS